VKVHIWHYGNTLLWWGTLEFVDVGTFQHLSFSLQLTLRCITIWYVTFLCNGSMGHCCYEVSILVILHLMNWLISQYWMSLSLHNLGVGNVEMLPYRTFAKIRHVWIIKGLKNLVLVFNTNVMFLIHSKHNKSNVNVVCLKK